MNTHILKLMIVSVSLFLSVAMFADEQEADTGLYTVNPASDMGMLLDRAKSLKEKDPNAAVKTYFKALQMIEKEPQEFKDMVVPVGEGRFIPLKDSILQRLFVLDEANAEIEARTQKAFDETFEKGTFKLKEDTVKPLEDNLHTILVSSMRDKILSFTADYYIEKGDYLTAAEYLNLSGKDEKKIKYISEILYKPLAPPIGLGMTGSETDNIEKGVSPKDPTVSLKPVFEKEMNTDIQVITCSTGLVIYDDTKAVGYNSKLFKLWEKDFVINYPFVSQNQLYYIHNQKIVSLNGLTGETNNYSLPIENIRDYNLFLKPFLFAQKIYIETINPRNEHVLIIYDLKNKKLIDQIHLEDASWAEKGLSYLSGFKVWKNKLILPALKGTGIFIFNLRTDKMKSISTPIYRFYNDNYNIINDGVIEFQLSSSFLNFDFRGMFGSERFVNLQESALREAYKIPKNKFLQTIDYWYEFHDNFIDIHSFEPNKLVSQVELKEYKSLTDNAFKFKIFNTFLILTNKNRVIIFDLLSKDKIDASMAVSYEALPSKEEKINFLIKQLFNEDIVVRRWAQSTLVPFGMDAFYALRKGLDSPVKPGNDRPILEEAMERILIYNLSLLLKNMDERLDLWIWGYERIPIQERIALLSITANSKDEKAMSLLLKALNDSEPSIRVSAVLALSVSLKGTQKLKDLLEERFKTERNGDVQKAIVQELVNIHTRTLKKEEK